MDNSYIYFIIQVFIAFEALNNCLFRYIDHLQFFKKYLLFEFPRIKKCEGI